ncbi:hypothetical protein KW785_01440 [Candidatus Parcubacteria bacterium]|nr:hypothetical protein [Candidatus Parcubacteria bacterium]
MSESNLPKEVQAMLDRCKREDASIGLLTEVNTLKEERVKDQDFDSANALREAERNIQIKLRECKLPPA